MKKTKKEHLFWSVVLCTFLMTCILIIGARINKEWVFSLIECPLALVIMFVSWVLGVLVIYRLIYNFEEIWDNGA